MFDFSKLEPYANKGKIVARCVAGHGRYQARHYCRATYCIITPAGQVVGIITRMSAGGGYEHGCYWEALDHREGGPHRGVRSALEAFVREVLKR